MTTVDPDPQILLAALGQGRAREWTDLDVSADPAMTDRVVMEGGTAFAEYTSGDGRRRHAVVDLTDGAPTNWRDHGDSAARTSTERSDPVVDAAGADDVVVSAGVDAEVSAAVYDFFDVHQDRGFDGVLSAWRAHAHPEVVLWHSAEGVRGRGIEQVIAFYTRQHETYPYAGFRYEMKVLAARTGYAAGEIEYLLDDPAGGDSIRLLSTFALDLDGESRIVGWRDYSRFWIPE